MACFGLVENWGWVFWVTEGMEKGTTHWGLLLVPACSAAMPPPVLPVASPAARGGDTSAERALGARQRAAREDQGAQVKTRWGSARAQLSSVKPVPGSQRHFTPSTGTSPLTNSSSSPAPVLRRSWSFELATAFKPSLPSAAHRNDPRPVTTPRPLNRLPWAGSLPWPSRAALSAAAALRRYRSAKSFINISRQSQEARSPSSFQAPDRIDVKQEAAA